MRRWLVVMFLMGVAASAQAKPSNPAFLGIGMQDLGGTGTGPCMITEVTRNSGAEDSGLQPGDIVETIDGTAISNCDGLLAAIQKRLPNDKIAIRANRDGTTKAVTAALWPRDEVLRRRGLVGQPAAGELVNIEDETEVDLSEQNRATIVGWFSPRCRNCESAFHEVSKWSREHAASNSRAGRPVSVVAAMRADDSKTLKQVIESAASTQRALGVPLLLADSETYKTHAISEDDRIYFMVIDCRGVVQHLAPVSPDADDTDAVLDDLYAAADQAVHAR